MLCKDFVNCYKILKFKTPAMLFQFALVLSAAGHRTFPDICRFNCYAPYAFQTSLFFRLVFDVFVSRRLGGFFRVYQTLGSNFQPGTDGHVAHGDGDRLIPAHRRGFLVEN